MWNDWRRILCEGVLVQLDQGLGSYQCFQILDVYFFVWSVWYLYILLLFGIMLGYFLVIYVGVI